MHALMTEAQAAGVKLWTEGGALRYSAPATVAPELLARLKAHKAELLAALAPPAPLHGNAPPAPDPEAQAERLAGLDPARPVALTRTERALLADFVRACRTRPDALAMLKCWVKMTDVARACWPPPEGTGWVRCADCRHWRPKVAAPDEPPFSGRCVAGEPEGLLGVIGETERRCPAFQPVEIPL